MIVVTCPRCGCALRGPVRVCVACEAEADEPEETDATPLESDALAAARLYAAAPDLLEACKLALDYLEHGSEPRPGYGASRQYDIGVLRRAIARAEARD